jgi:hypothetical protein
MTAFSRCSILVVAAALCIAARADAQDASLGALRWDG